MVNWLRQYRLVAGPSGGTGFEIGEEINGRALHIAFNVQKNAEKASNEAKIQVWNLTQEHRAMLKEKNCVVELRAGYGDLIRPIFVGIVSNVTEQIDGSDRYIEVECAEGTADTDAVATVSLTGEVMCRQVADIFVKEMGIPSVIYTEAAEKVLEETKYDNGFAFIGKAKDGFSNVCNKCGLKWSLQNGVLQVYNFGETVTQQGYLLSSETGLINIPNKIKIKEKGSESNDKSKGTEMNGYEIEYFINGAIGVNDLIYVKSKELDGSFRVHSIEISGDNYDGDWICTAEIVEA